LRPEEIPESLMELWGLLKDMEGLMGRTPARLPGRPAMLLDFLEAFNKRSDEDWIWHPSLRHNLDAGLLPDKMGNGADMELDISTESTSSLAEAAQKLQHFARGVLSLRDRMLSRSTEDDADKEMLMDAQHQFSAHATSGFDSGRGDAVAMRALSEALRTSGDFEHSMMAERAAERAECLTSINVFWKAFRTLSHGTEAACLRKGGTDLFDAMQIRGASSVAALLPEAGPSEGYMEPRDAVVAVRLLCQAGRISDALRWAAAVPDEASPTSVWATPNLSSELSRALPTGAGALSVKVVLRSLILKWCWEDAIEIGGGSDEDTSLALGKRSRLGSLVRLALTLTLAPI